MNATTQNEPKPRGGRIKWIALAVLATGVLVVGGYAGALAWFAPDDAKLTAWQLNLDQALADAKKSNRLVLVKAGSKW